MASQTLPEGLYETLVTEVVQAAIDRTRAERLQVTTEPVDGAMLQTLVRRRLDDLFRSSLGGDEAGLTMAREVSRQVAGEDGLAEFPAPGAPALVLKAVHRAPTAPEGPSTPLSMSALLTNARDEPRLGLELEREIATADEVDALVSFVTWEGWRRLQPAFEALVARGGRLRLITTTYTGATDAEAVAALAGLGPNVAVRVSYDGRRTRLHAKAWLFRRRSGFHTAWVGSANLSGAALSSGLEWTMKASVVDLPHVVEKFEGTFETLWNEGEFEPFGAGDLERLKEALARESGKATPVSSPHFFATLQPYPFQQEILDRLEAERTLHDRRRNLVVAATGTGKTLIAAFDYERFARAAGRRPNLLFVAHREELLQQSLGAFRHVLRDGAFGELLGAGHVPRSHDHLFTTVQSFASRGLARTYPADHWRYVVVDECHHSTAETYRQVVDTLRPEVLLGLTATPERADGQDILPAFDGRIAAEVRLWSALDRQLLCPFDYFGLSDETDLSAVKWGRGGYDLDELGNLYTGDDRRAELVIAQFQRHRGRVHDARALGFCATVAHARFMARKFSEAGIPAAVVHGGSTEAERGELPRRLERREVNVLFTCDLYNEGVDLPFVDTLLFLRPTSSPTVYLQQLGRGLRLAAGKTSCLVLDFVAKASRREFRFDRLLTAVTGIARGRLAEAVRTGFPQLPSGCSMRLDAVARGVVLQNLKESLQGGEQRLRRELVDASRRHGPEVTLAQFLEDTGRPLEDVYDVGSFTSLRVAAGLDGAALDDREKDLSRRLGRLLHADDPAQLRLMQAPSVGLASAEGCLRLLMLGYQLWDTASDTFEAVEVVRRLEHSPRLARELSVLAERLEDGVALAPVGRLPDAWPLQLHRCYSRREILTATGLWTGSAKRLSQAGVERVGPNGEDELLFVTLVKDEKRFSPTTRYHDYAISRELFHWQSQGRTGEDSRFGQRYRTNGARFWLCVRRAAGEPFRFLGAVRYVRHEGSKPMNITWRLSTPMPAAHFDAFASLRAA